MFFNKEKENFCFFQCFFIVFDTIFDVCLFFNCFIFVLLLNLFVSTLFVDFFQICFVLTRIAAARAAEEASQREKLAAARAAEAEKRRLEVRRIYFSFFNCNLIVFFVCCSIDGTFGGRATKEIRRRSGEIATSIISGLFCFSKMIKKKLIFKCTFILFLKLI